MRGRLIFDEPRWWQRTGGRVAAALGALAATAAWWVTTTPAADEVPVVARATAAPSLGRVLAVVEAPPVPLPAPPVSAEIAPGVHVTPLSVPPGTLPVPAGPRPDDSEPEN
jgi:hypothetical protein